LTKKKRSKYMGNPTCECAREVIPLRRNLALDVVEPEKDSEGR